MKPTTPELVSREIMFATLLAEWLRDQHPYWYDRYSQSRFTDVRLWLSAVLEEARYDEETLRELDRALEPREPRR